MYAISLTSIPPRLPLLLPVLNSLLAQRPAPAHVFLCLPKTWARFPKASPQLNLPPLPQNVTLIRSDEDLGPATKALPAAQKLAGTETLLIYCDDDWLYPPGWADALLAAKRPGQAVAASGFDVVRLKRHSHHSAIGKSFVDIAQGYSGVLIEPAWLASQEARPPSDAWPADDIWLSGQLARQDIPIRHAPKAQRGLSLGIRDAHSLQDTTIEGRNRNASNQACLDYLSKTYGIWPKL